VSDVPKATAFLIEQDADQLSGIFIKARAMRLYIHGRTTAHLIGYVGKMREDEYPELKKYGYRIKDVVGRSGLEKSFDKILRGKPGGMQLEVDSEGKIVNVLSYRPPVRGSDVHTTIDINLQQMLAELVGESKGAVVVMDADSGDILGMYSGPSFDPNVIIAKKNFIEIGKILKDTSAPLLNRNLKAYPAGSIFKIITAYAGLRERVIGIHDSFYCSGEFVIGNSTRHCWLRRGHGNVNIVRALTTSCNVFFWEVGLKVGQKMLSRYAEEFGLGKVTHVELNGEHSGLVPNARWKNTELHQRWYAGDTANFSIGQGYLLISPLQALQMVALLANGGREVRPHIVRRHDIPEKSKRILSQEVIAVINRGMRQVVNSVDGTGHRAFIEGEEVFAKTGTAQVANGTAHAWFIGYTVIERKKICFAVFLEHGGHGGERPAEIAKQIVMYVHETSRQQTSDTRHQTPQ